MSLSRTTAAILMQSHVAYTTEETERPLPSARAVAGLACIAFASQPQPSPHSRCR